MAYRAADGKTRWEEKWKSGKGEKGNTGIEEMLDEKLLRLRTKENSYINNRQNIICICRYFQHNGLGNSKTPD